MPADAVATLGAMASTGMVLTPESQTIPSPASEELIRQHLNSLNYANRRLSIVEFKMFVFKVLTFQIFVDG